MTAALLAFSCWYSLIEKDFTQNRKMGPVVLRRLVYLIGGESVNSISNSRLPLFPLDLVLSNARVTQPPSTQVRGARLLRRCLVGRPWRVYEVTFKCRFSLETVADIFSSGLLMDRHGQSRAGPVSRGKYLVMAPTREWNPSKAAALPYENLHPEPTVPGKKGAAKCAPGVAGSRF